MTKTSVNIERKRKLHITTDDSIVVSATLESKVVVIKLHIH
jgi:hypothetical protein